MTDVLAEGSLRVVRPTKTLRELTLDKVRDSIISGHFLPGERLVERDLCAQLGVSRTVVREVLRHLESEGIVTNLANKGPMVARLDPTEIRQIYEIRGVLAGLAARRCAEKRDPAIAALLGETLDYIRRAYATNDMAEVLARTTAFYETLFKQVERHLAWGFVRSMAVRISHLCAITIRARGQAVDGPAQMGAIVEAIRRGEPEAAEKGAVAHVMAACSIAEATLASSTVHA